MFGQPDQPVPQLHQLLYQPRYLSGERLGPGHPHRQWQIISALPVYGFSSPSTAQVTIVMVQPVPLQPSATTEPPTVTIQVDANSVPVHSYINVTHNESILYRLFRNNLPVKVEIRNDQAQYVTVQQMETFSVGKLHRCACCV